MTNEQLWVKALLSWESEGLPVKKRTEILQAFKDGKITLKNLQVCLDRIQDIRQGW
tara:strand:- start:7814 stop:7981 length:168 start_codon:yes stop_codon:yes gene_type:complete